MIICICVVCVFDVGFLPLSSPHWSFVYMTFGGNKNFQKGCTLFSCVS